MIFFIFLVYSQKQKRLTAINCKMSYVIFIDVYSDRDRHTYIAIKISGDHEKNMQFFEKIKQIAKHVTDNSDDYFSLNDQHTFTKEELGKITRCFELQRPIVVDEIIDESKMDRAMQLYHTSLADDNTPFDEREIYRFFCGAGILDLFPSGRDKLFFGIPQQ